MMMAGDFLAWIVNAKGTFLKGKFTSKDEVLLLEVPRWIYDKLGEEMEKELRRNYDASKGHIPKVDG
jgi:hypothetical protein